MKYNEKYDLYIDDDYVIYYWDNKLDKLMQSIVRKSKNGYLRVCTKIGTQTVHRIIYETFVGPIPNGYEIDHVDGNKTDNRPEKLKLVTHTENMNNPITRKRISESQKGNTYTRGKTFSEFGRKFKEHYGITRYQNINLYEKEHIWYKRHNYKCRWE